jgi:hypothetical protein
MKFFPVAQPHKDATTPVATPQENFPREFWNRSALQAHCPQGPIKTLFLAFPQFEEGGPNWTVKGRPNIFLAAR